MSIIDKLTKRSLITPPKHLKNSIQFEAMVGSTAYGVAGETSDIDIYGFSIPPKGVIFPHLDGFIPGFDTQTNKFEQYQQHHIIDKTDIKEYDITIFNIVKYFTLCMQNNPNIIDSLFVPQRCIVHITQIGELVRGNRKLFLHKGSWHRFKGYAYSQLHKMKIKKPNPESKRYESVQKYGFSTKFALHIIRLLNEVEQILMKGDLDLEENREQLKSVKNGGCTQDQIFKYFDEKEKQLEEVYLKSTLQYKPNKDKIRNLLIDCLEQYYGDLNKVIRKKIDVDVFLEDLGNFIDSYK